MRVALWRVVVLAAVGLSTSQRAFADAVPPPPEHCPPGYVAVTSHHGPECLPKASTRCKPGYCAERGGSRPRAVNDAAAYGNGPPPAVEPRGVAVPPAVESATPTDSATPAESATPAASATASGVVSPTHGGNANGCSKGCTVSSASGLATWLVLPFLALTALGRRRAASRQNR